MEGEKGGDAELLRRRAGEERGACKDRRVRSKGRQRAGSGGYI